VTVDDPIPESANALPPGWPRSSTGTSRVLSLCDSETVVLAALPMDTAERIGRVQY